ncbi:S1 family peptidase [Streptomonospora sp. S1-112]|uniref:S1 family peptidase n=1 Tax=Streptomonospora mangrovi TaxID=2883123 RepID=A0A9X3NM44_9ACTN|nr:S1 family peptidase [Streptomonospora mangrovi]MDA0563030.1 S1 family peptidase [Streptomonospora mangrovi]
MRKNSVSLAVGGAALALGLAAVPVAAAADDAPPEQRPTPLQAAASQAEALQRDLGLSAEEADTLFAEQRRAGAVEDELRQRLGDSFGGARFDVETARLTVAVTDSAAAREVREAGAEPQVVEHGQDVLNAAVADLNREGADLSEGITGWYPSTAADRVVITVLAGTSGAEDAARAFAADAGVPADLVRVEETSAAPELYADVIGGDPYTIDGSGRCSIGFATETGFVTAGHCGAAGTSVSSEDGSGTGTVTDSVFPGSDMAVVETDANWTPVGQVNDYAGGTVAVAGSEEAAEGAAVCRSGSTTGWHCGTIGAKNQSVTYPEGTVEGLTETDVCAEPGDSGGSWLSGDQAQGVTSGGSGDCTSGGTTYFQPVNPILEEFGATLLTG